MAEMMQVDRWQVEMNDEERRLSGGNASENSNSIAVATKGWVEKLSENGICCYRLCIGSCKLVSLIVLGATKKF